MELGEALKRCVLMSEATPCPNAQPEWSAKLYLQLDPTTEAGAMGIAWYNSMDPLTKIEVSNEPAKGVSLELAPQN